MSTFAPRHRQTQHPVAAGTWGGLDILSYPVGNRVGEAPCWHPEHQCLYWIDVRAQQLLKLSPESAAIDRWDLPEVVGALGLCTGNQVCLALTHSLVHLQLDTGRVDDFAKLEKEPPTNRLNDGKVSPSGNWFVFGSMDDSPQKSATGALYCVSPTGKVNQLHEGLTVCNGIAWSLDATSLYFSDSAKGLLYRAPWNEQTGVMGPPGIFATLNEEQGRPDGGVVDLDDNYWSAGVSAGCINILSRAGRIIQSLPLPLRAPTMCAFGGHLGDVLYVTSLIRPQWQTAGQHDGALLRIPLLTPGPITPLFKSSTPSSLRF